MVGTVVQSTNLQEAERKLHKRKKKTRGRKKKYKMNWETRFNIAINTQVSIITLNINRLNVLIKRYKVADWIIKQDPST